MRRLLDSGILSAKIFDDLMKKLFESRKAHLIDVYKKTLISNHNILGKIISTHPEGQCQICYDEPANAKLYSCLARNPSCSAGGTETRVCAECAPKAVVRTLELCTERPECWTCKQDFQAPILRQFGFNEDLIEKVQEGGYPIHQEII